MDQTATSSRTIAKSDSPPEEAQRKKFTVNDFLTYKDNAPVIKTFLYYSVSIALGPIVAFYVAQNLVLAFNIPGVTDGTVAGLITSLIVALSLMGAYAYHAYQEEKRDYYFSQCSEEKRSSSSRSDKKSQ